MFIILSYITLSAVSIFTEKEAITPGNNTPPIFAESEKAAKNLLAQGKEIPAAYQYIELGTLYVFAPKKGQQYLVTAMQIFNKHNNWEGLLNIYPKLASLYATNHNDAIGYYQKALNVIEDNNNIPPCFAAVHNTYNGLAEIYSQTQQDEKAVKSLLKNIEYYKECLQGNQKEESTMFTIQSYTSLAHIFRHHYKDKEHEADQFLLEANKLKGIYQ